MLVKRTMKWLLSIVLIAMMYAYAMFQGGFVSWFLFYSVVPLIIYAFVIGLFPLKTIKVKRILPAEPKQAGQPLQVTIEIKKSFFPLFYLIVEDRLSAKLKGQLSNRSDAKAIFFPLFKRNMTFSYTIPSLPRGEHTLSTIIIKTGDLFGFIQKQVEHDVEQTLLVYPQIETLNWQPSSRGVSGDRLLIKNNQQDVSTVVGIRDYVPGDRLTWIDWKTTAKRNKLVTKQFEQRVTEKTLLFLNDSKASYKMSEQDLFEKAVTVTASLVSAIERSGHPFVMPGYSELKHGALDQSRHRYYTMLAKVEAMREASFAEFVKSVLVRYEKGFRVVFVSAHVSNELLKLLNLLASQNIHVDFYYVMSDKNKGLTVVRQLQATGVTVHAITKQKAGEKSEDCQK